MCPKILGVDAKLWEDWIFLFADKGQMQVSRVSLLAQCESFLRFEHRQLSPMYQLTTLNSVDWFTR
jgi:hypothetical protein